MFYLGLDLGQTSDPSAACILEPHGEDETRAYDVRYLEQFRLGTSYPALVHALCTLMDRRPLAGACTLVIDHTGVGRPVFDLFTEAGLSPIGITITGGNSWHLESARQYHVAKLLLVSTVQKFLQSGRLRVSASLKHATTLQTELRDFRVKISKQANELYSAREGSTDDILLSAACALWYAEHAPVVKVEGPLIYLGPSTTMTGAPNIGHYWR
jgi:hypothetical protein